MSTHLRVVNLKDISALRMFIEGADLMISNSTIATYKHTVSIFLPVNLGGGPTPRTSMEKLTRGCPGDNTNGTNPKHNSLMRDKIFTPKSTIMSSRT